ncbi:MAG: sugar phosphate isomerase/epimerase family protein [Deltaproteobacteria bacterium]
MKLSFLFYEPIPDLPELSRRMERLAAMGYQGVELSAMHPPPYPAEELLRVSQQHKLPVVSFLSGWSYSHEKLCLASPDSGVRQRAVDRLESYVDYAAPLHSLVVVGLMQGLRSDEPDGALAAKRIADCLRRAAERAAARGATLVLEPVNHLQVGFHHTATEAAALVARVDSPALGYMLDTIHLHIEERSVCETILEHGRRIRHFHLCESNGAAFGTGAIDFPRVLAALRKSGYGAFVSVKIYR